MYDAEMDKSHDIMHDVIVQSHDSQDIAQKSKKVKINIRLESSDFGDKYLETSYIKWCETWDSIYLGAGKDLRLWQVSWARAKNNLDELLSSTLE